MQSLCRHFEDSKPAVMSLDDMSKTVAGIDPVVTPLVIGAILVAGYVGYSLSRERKSQTYGSEPEWHSDGTLIRYKTR